MTLSAILLRDSRSILKGPAGVDGSLSPAAGGAPVPLRGFFRSPYSSQGLGDLSAGGGAYRFQCLSEDLAGANARRGTLTIDGKDYRISDVKPDELAPGWTTLYLGA
jgi:hypothetical protein